MKISCAEIEKHDHACSLFNTNDEFIGYAVSMVRRSLNSHEQCLVLTDEIPADDIKRYLSLLDLSPEALLDSGQLVFGQFGQFYLDGGTFHRRDMVHNVEKAARAALKLGFSGLRGIGELGQSLKHVDFTDFLNYEMEVQGLFFQYPISALCAYRRSALDEDQVEKLLNIHPFHLVRSLALF